VVPQPNTAQLSGLRLGTNAGSQLLIRMTQKHELQAIVRRERRIDEALKETFPASDPPSFVGAGAYDDDDKARTRMRRTKAAEMAGEAIDQHTDPSASSDEQESRKQRLLRGPAEFREFRRDHPARKLK
jgi:hypothetical protein